jgi:radical SAM protein with 4Fe4S-binding SPASM domain
MDVNRIPTVWLPITYRCNNRCEWCYAKNEVSKSKDLSDKNESLFLDFLSDLDVKKIVLIGGEPTLYKNIPRLIKESYKRNIVVGMVSNGRKLADYDFCKELGDSGIYSTTISIEGSNEKLHDKITGIKGSFNQSISGLENLIKVGINASTETVMNKDNEHDLENVVSLTENYELKQSAYSICGPCIAEEGDSEFSLSLNEGAKLFEKIFKRAKYKERTKLITSSTICSFDSEIYKEMKKNKAVSRGCHVITGSRFVLEPNGDIIPCVHFAGLPIMNIFKGGNIMSAGDFLKEYNSPEGTNKKFRKILAKYPSNKCNEGKCWGNDCSGGCPIFWSQYNPTKEIKGLIPNNLK